MRLLAVQYGKQAHAAGFCKTEDCEPAEVILWSKVCSLS
jgi:hypothetical protein